MRFLVLSVSALCATGLICGHAVAQTSQTLPYSTHVDRRHGNDHVYPDRGAIVRDLPRGAAVVDYAGISYRFVGGVWYQSLGPAYMVVAPPVGLVVPRLPPVSVDFDIAGKTYFYADDVFYSERPDSDVYEVVNDPDDEVAANEEAADEPAPSRIAATASPDEQPVMTTAAASPVRPPAEPAAQPDEVMAPARARGNPTRVAIQPRDGQSADQQATDRYECYRFAVARSGFDPLASYGPTRAVARSDFEFSRAQARCLEGRGYSVL